MVILAALAVAMVAVGLVATFRADRGLVRTTTVVDGIPLTLVREAGSAAGRPGAVVVHGYAGSARLMQPFADTLARNGYLVVLPDLAGQGSSERPLSDPLPEVDTAVRFLRESGADPARIVLVGHSRGAAAVVEYAASHRDVAATVGLSLGETPPNLPRNVLLLYGQLESDDLADVARDTLELAEPGVEVATGHTYGSVADGTARRAEPVPGVEHVSILYSPATHARTLAWLDATVRPGAPQGTVHPLDRLWPAGLLLLGLLIGFVPLARLVFGSADAPRSSTRWSRAGLALGAGLAGGAAVGVVTSGPVLGLAVGGYAAVVLVAFGAVAALTMGRPRLRWPGWSRLAQTALMVVYAGAMMAVPLQLGVTWVVPNLARAIPLALMGVTAWVLFGAAERLGGGRWTRHALVLAAGLALLVVLSGMGFGPSFLVLIMPLLVGLLAIGAGIAAVLRRLGVDPWLAAAVAAPVFAFTVAMTLPLTH
jgi:pimeloyl-ACP methyl ester carboxylesterase